MTAEELQEAFDKTAVSVRYVYPYDSGIWGGGGLKCSMKGLIKYQGTLFDLHILKPGYIFTEDQDIEWYYRNKAGAYEPWYGYIRPVNEKFECIVYTKMYRLIKREILDLPLIGITDWMTKTIRAEEEKIAQKKAVREAEKPITPETLIIKYLAENGIEATKHNDCGSWYVRTGQALETMYIFYDTKDGITYRLGSQRYGKRRVIPYDLADPSNKALETLVRVIRYIGEGYTKLLQDNGIVEYKEND